LLLVDKLKELESSFAEISAEVIESEHLQIRQSKGINKLSILSKYEQDDGDLEALTQAN
jgi:hypothetical protein